MDMRSGGVRQFGFSRRSQPPLDPKQSSVQARSARLATDAPECVLCLGPPSPLLATARGASLCEACALGGHDVAPDGASCRLCGSQGPPIRGHDDRTICEGCLSYARAILSGDDL